MANRLSCSMKATNKETAVRNFSTLWCRCHALVFDENRVPWWILCYTNTRYTHRIVQNILIHSRRILFQRNIDIIVHCVILRWLGDFFELDSFQPVAASSVHWDAKIVKSKSSLWQMVLCYPWTRMWNDNINNNNNSFTPNRPSHTNDWLIRFDVVIIIIHHSCGRKNRRLEN